MHPMRSCPRCHVPMSAKKLAFAEVDFCPDCGGAFFDPGEAMTVHSANAEPAWLIEQGRARRAGSSQLACPAHEQGPAMTIYHVGDESDPVEIDYCHACGGAFLDMGEGGELTDAVLSMERAFVEGASGARFAAPPTGNAARVVAEAREKEGRGFFSELMRGIVDVAVQHERSKRIIRRTGGPSGPFSPYDD